MDANNLKKAFELFVKLQDKKVKLSNVDGKIKYRAPSGIMEKLFQIKKFMYWIVKKKYARWVLLEIFSFLV